jgi:hypothetical protein
MNLDFSTIVMAKYTSTTKSEQFEGDRNSHLDSLHPYYGKFQRNIMTTCLRPAQDLKFGKNFLMVDTAKVPDENPDEDIKLSEHKSELEAGTVPDMNAFSFAKHYQKGPNGEDITESGDDLFFEMNWYSIPTNPITINKSVFEQ